MMDLREKIARAVRERVENTTYRWGYSNGMPDEDCQTYREFLDDSWQSDYADEIFQRAAEAAADAILDLPEIKEALARKPLTSHIVDYSPNPHTP